MLFVQRDENYITHCIACGVVTGKYNVSTSVNGKKQVLFTMVYTSNPKTKEYFTVKVLAHDKNAEQLVKYSKQTHTQLVAMGGYGYDKETSERKGVKSYIIYANVVFSPSALSEMFDWHQATMKFDKQLESLVGKDRKAKDIRYDFETQVNPEDHMI